MLKRTLVLTALILTGAASTGANATVECDFNALSDGQIDGQTGWKVYDKVRTSASFAVAAGVGTTEAAEDRALVVKRSGETLRCVTDDAVRWLREQTACIEFDFRLVVPNRKMEENEPVMILLMGNSILSEHARWEVRVDVTTNGTWMLAATLPVEVSAPIPREKVEFVTGETTIISDWMHCVVEVKKLAESDSFTASVEVLGPSGDTLTSLRCVETDKSLVTRAIWNLSRLHAGFLASRDIHGLACIDNFMLSTKP